jgi:putative SOS response-associated peptidase YedK
VRQFHRKDDMGRDRRALSTDARPPPHNLQARYNVCPTDPIDVAIERDGKRDFVRVDQDEGNATLELARSAA